MGNYPWLTASKIHRKHAQIAQNCVYDVQKMFAEVGVAEKGGVKTWEWGKECHGC